LKKEADYAYRLRKPIIPLIMQPDFMPDGWLGILLGAKMYIDFPKYGFEKSMDKLIGEISHLIKPTVPRVTHPTTQQVNELAKQASAENQVNSSVQIEFENLKAELKNEINVINEVIVKKLDNFKFEVNAVLHETLCEWKKSCKHILKLSR
jgi:hypothetical protein